MLKIAVIGAGKGGSALLDIFHTNGSVEIVGVTDRDKNAPGLNLAKEWSIFIAEDIKELYGQKPDIVINATGKPEISKFIVDNFPYPSEVLEGKSAKLLWELVNRQQASKKDMEVLYQNGLLITKAKNLKQVLDEVLRSAMELTETPAGSIALFEGGELIMATQQGLSKGFLKNPRWKPRGNGVTRHILKQKGPVEFSNIDKEPIYENTNILKEGIKSILASPLQIGGDMVGILYLDDFKPREFTERHKNLISLFSTFAAQAIHKYKLIHKLEESLAYFQGILDDSQDMIITTDQEGCIVKFSRGGERILGYKADEIIGKNASELYVCKGERTSILETIKKKGAIYNYETKLIKKDGSSVDISLTISELRDKTDNVIGTVGVSKDITEEKRIRKEIKNKNEELEQRNFEITTLAEMTNKLQVINTTEEAYTAISQSISILFPTGALFTYTPSRNLLNVVSNWGKVSVEDPVSPNDCYALRLGRLHLFMDAKSDMRCHHVGESTNPYLCVPLIGHGEILGVLYLSFEPLNTLINKDRIESKRQLAIDISERIGLALTTLNLHNTLRNLSIRDALTGLYNRRYMEESLEREIFRANRKGTPLGVVMLDIDHFKRFNDQHGHVAGDAILCEIGALLQRHIRSCDIACRYGGEEFILILPEATLEMTRERAEQLREIVKNIRIQSINLSLCPVTLSFGVAAFPDHGSTTEIIVKMADTALYRAKAEGRDRVCVAKALH